MSANEMLSKHFSKKELACKHCDKAPIAKSLLTGLEKLRALANRPLFVLSGYRCPEHNRREGGATNSMHIIGRAADIQADQLTAYELLGMVKQVTDFTGYGFYVAEHFVHVDTRPGPLATWGRVTRHGSYTTLALAEENWIRQQPENSPFRALLKK